MKFAGEWLKLRNATVRTSVYIDKKARDGSMIGRKKKDFREKGGEGKRLHAI